MRSATEGAAVVEMKQAQQAAVDGDSAGQPEEPQAAQAEGGGEGEEVAQLKATVAQLKATVAQLREEMMKRLVPLEVREQSFLDDDQDRSQQVLRKRITRVQLIKNAHVIISHQ